MNLILMGVKKAISYTMRIGIGVTGQQSHLKEMVSAAAVSHL
jgi:hypothetical protein